MAATHELTLRQDLFAREYITDLNATQAALRAGYTPTSAKANCAQLLNNPKIKARIDELMADRVERVTVKADYVLGHIQKIAEQAEEEGSWHAALRALELLGRHLGLWKRRDEIALTVSANPFARGQDEDALQHDVERLVRIAGSFAKG